MEQKKQEPIRDARQLGTAKMLILGLQHMFAMFGATILVPILVSGYFQKACGEPLTRGLSVSVTLFCAGFGTLIFHLCTKFKVPAFLGSSFAFLGGFYTVANLDSGMYANMAVNDKAAYACGGIFVAIPTAIPDVPFTRRFGNLDGSTVGSFSVSSKFGIKSTVFLLMSAVISMEILLRRASV